MKSGASQNFHFNQCLAEKQEKKSTKRIPILRSSLGLHQMKTKSGEGGAAEGGSNRVYLGKSKIKVKFQV